MAINDKYYNKLFIQELHMCTHTKYEYFCGKQLLVKQKYNCNCRCAIFFGVPRSVIESNHKFNYEFNITVTPSILDRSPKLFLQILLIKTDKYVLLTSI